MANIALKNSLAKPLNNVVSKVASKQDSNIEITLLLRRRNNLLQHTTLLNHDIFKSNFGLIETDVDLIKAFANQYNLIVSAVYTGSRTVKLFGSISNFELAFGIKLYDVNTINDSHRTYDSEIKIPEELDGIIEHVMGFDNRKIAKPHIKFSAISRATSTSYTVNQLSSAYNFPQSTGAGQCVALIELGGGYTQNDLDEYFASLNITSSNVFSISVDGATNSPGQDADSEVLLDIEIVAGLVPESKVAVYFSPNTNAGFLSAINAAIHDSVNKPSVISISWGGEEDNWSHSDMIAFDDAFQSAKSLGITVCVAAGDNGATDGGYGFNVDFPASSPNVLACGGTRLYLDQNNHIISETVWNDSDTGSATGGGVSSFFNLPSYQHGLIINEERTNSALLNRGVPDVSAVADPDTGYVVVINGQWTIIGGTSAVAPLYAALIARHNAINNTRLGFVNNIVYQNKNNFNDIIDGNNGGYFATSGWDACTGLGTPKGDIIFSGSIKQLPPISIPPIQQPEPPKHFIHQPPPVFVAPPVNPPVRAKAKAKTRLGRGPRPAL